MIKFGTEMKSPTIVDIPGTSFSDLSFAGCLQPCSPAPANYGIGANKEEGNNPMNYASATVTAATTEVQDQRKYLENRLRDVYSEKRNPLEATFGLIDDDAPTGPAELAKRLADGAYTLKTGDKYAYWGWFDLIQWRHPDRKQDTEGFSAAVAALKAEKQKALDIIKIEDPKAGLDAIKALEAWTPTGKAN